MFVAWGFYRTRCASTDHLENVWFSCVSINYVDDADVKFENHLNSQKLSLPFF